MSHIVSYPTDEEMPRFMTDMCEPLFDLIRGLHTEQRIEVLGQYWQFALDSKDDEPHEYSGLTLTDLALETFAWNIYINQPREGAEPHNALGLFMEVAQKAWAVRA